MTEIGKKKVLLVITKSNWGGAQRYVFDVATNLNKEKFEVTVALGGDGPLKQKLELGGIRVISIPHLGRDVKITNDLKVFSTLRKLFRQEKPDILHLNSSKIGAMGSLVGRLTGISKIIFTAHGWAFNEDRKALSKVSIRLIAWFTIALSHQTIAVSNSVAERIKKWPGVGSKMTVISNGINLDLKTENEARQILFGDQIPQKTLILGTIGELHPVKGHRYLIEALADLNDFDYICTIIGEGEERKSLEELIRVKRLENKVYLFGHIDQAGSLLKSFDIFLLPSLSEALGYAVLEAGAAGLPVIASRVGGIPEIIANLKSGLLVTPRRPNEIKNALIYLIDHPEEMKSFGKNLKQTVEEKFSLKQMISETEKLYS
ncbi:MAG TPA: glycosyltransferase family 4 protein [Candidatus Paceibacterota bacterium]|nr:glycosyltransferase family 4 protein [Candidatus Paceibacterota bacterium]